MYSKKAFPFKPVLSYQFFRVYDTILRKVCRFLRKVSLINLFIFLFIPFLFIYLLILFLHLWIGLFVFIFEIIKAIIDEGSNTTNMLQMCKLWLKLKQRESNF